MRITNTTGLPDPIANYADYADNRKYSAGGADFSVTTLIDSPRINQLLKKHRSELQKDVTEAAFTMLGSAMHLIWEQGASFDHITEERLYLTVNGKQVSGQIDLQEILPDGRVKAIDFKVTSVWSKLAGDGPKKEWVEQQNIYATLLEDAKGVEVESINICVLYRDYSQAQSERQADYPDAAIELIRLPLWSKTKRRKFLKDRVKRHAEAEKSLRENGTLPLCTNEERWYRPGKVALMKTGRKRAIKLFDSVDELMLWAREHGYTRQKTLGSHIKVANVLMSKFYAEEKPTSYVRCEKYCAVAPFCSQWKAEQVLKLIEDNE